MWCENRAKRCLRKHSIPSFQSAYHLAHTLCYDPNIFTPPPPYMCKDIVRSVCSICSVCFVCSSYSVCSAYSVTLLTLCSLSTLCTLSQRHGIRTSQGYDPHCPVEEQHPSLPMLAITTMNTSPIPFHPLHPLPLPPSSTPPSFHPLPLPPSPTPLPTLPPSSIPLPLPPPFAPSSILYLSLLPPSTPRSCTDDVFSVEVALDLNELEALTTQRRDVRHQLEKAIAVWKATGASFLALYISVTVLLCCCVCFFVVYFCV